MIGPTHWTTRFADSEARLSNIETELQDIHRRLDALDVESQEVVLGQAKSGDGWLGADTGMRAMPVVAMHEEGKLLGALL